MTLRGEVFRRKKLPELWEKLTLTEEESKVVIVDKESGGNRKDDDMFLQVGKVFSSENIHQWFI